MIIKKFLRSAVLFSALVLLFITAGTQNTQAANNAKGTKFIVTNHDTGGLVGRMDAESYGGFNSNTSSVSIYNTNGMSKEQYYSQLMSAVKENPGYAAYVFIDTGHGVVGGSGLGNADYSKGDALKAVTATLENNSVKGGFILDCCGSGDLANLYDISAITGAGAANQFVLMTTQPGQIGWTGFGDSVAYAVNNFDATDTNHDGVISIGELTAKLPTDNKTFKLMDKDAPFMFKNKATAEEYVKKNSKYCPVVTPGQSNGKDAGPDGTLPNYGPILSDEPFQKESELNRWLRTAISNSGNGYDTLKANIEKDKTSIGDKIKKWTIPSESQAQEFKSSNGKSYTVQGKKVQPGPYRVGQQITLPDGGEKVYFDAECNIKSWPDSNSNDNKNPGVNRDNNGNNNNNIGNQGNNQQNSLSNKLAETLKSLLGKNQQNQQQNPVNSCGGEYSPVCGMDGKTYPNQCIAVTQNKVNVQKFGVCGTQANLCPNTNQPVCGADGNTYPNRCTAETINRVAVAKEGSCVTVASDSLITSTNTLSSLLRYASTSGVPDSVLSGIIKTLTNLIMGFLTNNNSTEVLVP